MSPRPSIPLNQIPPGTTLFVAGAAVEKARDLALSLVVGGSAADDRLLLTTTETASDALLARCERLDPSVEFTRVAVIDCTDQDPGDVHQGAHVESLGTPEDLTGLGIKFSIMYENLSDGGSNRVLTGVVTVSTLLEHADLRTTVRFLRTASGRLDDTAGIGLFVLDPSAHDERTVATLQDVPDGWLEIRETADGPDELRVSGLPDQPEEWTPFSMPG